VPVYSLGNFKLDQLVIRRPSEWNRLSGNWRVSADMSRGPCKCRVLLGQVCECCVFAVNTELDQLARWVTVAWVRGARLQAEALGRQRGHASCQGIHECMCSSEPTVSYICCTTDLLPLPA